jgi:ABC-2 type transport system permease protein
MKGVISMETVNIFLRNIKWRLQNPLTVIMTLLQPLIWLLLYSTVFGDSNFDIPKGGYTGFILPGILVLVIFASSGSNGVINYIMKNKGSFYRIQISPVKRTSIVLGHILDSAVLSYLEIAVLFIISLFLSAELSLEISDFIPLVILFSLVIFFISSFSYTLSLILPDENIFFVIINTFVLPVFFVSTALIPYENISPAYKTVVLFNPFTHVINSIRNIVLENSADWSIFFQSVCIMSVLCVFSFILAVHYLNKSSNNI